MFVKCSNHSQTDVHGFELCGLKMHAWIFDRAGAISSTVIDIHADPQDFLHVMYGHMSMDVAAIGFEESITWEFSQIRTVFVSRRLPNTDRDQKLCWHLSI